MWIERDQYHFLILFLLHIVAIFLFWEERDIKFKQNTYLSLILIEVGYEK